MNGQLLERKVVIVNPHGLHMRPIAALAELARRFVSQVSVSKGTTVADAKSVMDMLTLNAPQGTELIIRGEGPDAEAALTALVELLNTFPIEEAHEPPASPAT